MSIQIKNTVNTILKMKQEGKPISMLTAYDYSFASIIDAAGMDIILVGDSASNVFSGNDTTLPISMDEMIYHTKAVIRATKRAMVIVDMPFGSYQISTENALKNAIDLVKFSGAQAVKMEGGVEIIPAVKKITAAGIPVMGHLGLTPQSIHQLGSYGVQAKSNQAQQSLIDSALCLQEAGCFSIVVEKIPAGLAERVSNQLNIPVIGIGSGNKCDGQVLVMHDLLGLNPNFKPKFIRKYADLHWVTLNAIKNYISDVQSKSFPNESESY